MPTLPHTAHWPGQPPPHYFTQPIGQGQRPPPHCQMQPIERTSHLLAAPYKPLARTYRPAHYPTQPIGQDHPPHWPGPPAPSLPHTSHWPGHAAPSLPGAAIGENHPPSRCHMRTGLDSPRGAEGYWGQPQGTRSNTPSLPFLSESSAADVKMGKKQSSMRLIHSFIYPITHSFNHSFSHSIIRSLNHSSVQLFIHSFIQLSIHSFSCSFTQSCIHRYILRVACVPALQELTG